MNKYTLHFIAISFLLFMGVCPAQEQYFLCGPDEDGCNPDEYSSCLCMPYDGPLASQAYCLDFDNLSCVPLSLMPNCPRGDIMKNQASCLATAFQSEPTPPCPLTTKEFCVTHKVAICDKDGGVNTCQ